MSKKHALSGDDKTLFRQLTSGIRPLKQDTVLHAPARHKTQALPQKRLISEQLDNSHFFSDEFQPLIASEGPTRYVRSDVSQYELKKLRRGEYTPDIFLDLHGLTREQARKELGALLAACRREHLFCASIMHGFGKHILKQQIPLWLAQHPFVMAFHQAPRLYGGDAALLVLIETGDRLLPGLR